MPVITIARQYGAGGSTVAAMVAELLGAELVDKWLIGEVARRAELAPSDVQAEDERPASLLARVVSSFGPISVGTGMVWEVPYPDPAYDPRRAILDLTRQVILEVARAGDAVIVGRGASVVLRERRGTVNVFLYADDAVRVESVMGRELVSESVARRRMHEIDTNRAAYLHQVYRTDWRDPLQYTLLLNTGVLGYSRTAEVILAVARPARAASEGLHEVLR